MGKAETPYVAILRRMKEARAETVRLAEELVQLLKEPSPDPFWDTAWSGIVERWESMETVTAALELCKAMIGQHNPHTLHNLSSQLRHWRRAQGEKNLGWLEVRAVNGYGPYIYWRWRDPGSRKIQTKYYGRADMLLDEMALSTDMLMKYEELMNEKPQQKGE
jgi:hypothetical protein